MAINSLSNEQKDILHLLTEFKCVDIYQLYDLFAPLPNDTIKMIIGILESKKYIDVKNDRFIMSYGQGSIDVEAMSCLWVMLKLRSERKDVTSAYSAHDPAFAYMTVGNKDSYELMYVTSGDSVKLRSCQERIDNYSKDPFCKAKYILVTTDQNLTPLLKKASFADDIFIAFLTYDTKTQIPDIKIMKKSAQKED
jgi:hypothetical protein